MTNYQFSLGSGKSDLRISMNVTRFDATCTSEFKHQLDKIWKPTIKTVILDFAAVQCIDSSGIGALIGIKKRLAADAPPVTLKNTHQRVEEVLKLLRLHRMFSLS